jgi:hypothetical protein
VKSWIGDVAAVAGVEHTMAHLEVASGDIVAVDPHSTSGDSAAIERWARHTFCVGRVRREMQQRLVSSTAVYGRR